ncbi:MAG: class I SAM-dependent methyltransferase [Acidimicrobiales bacterium]|nr:class I SAM-dependent methyltransferase [Acidimicrobiales bacterium]
MTSPATIGGTVPTDRMAGHWLLARMGKRILRPGGRELTGRLLGALEIGPGDDVIEIAPGLGSTTAAVLAANPATYVGIDRDPAAADRTSALLDGPHRTIVEASAASTGLADASADVVFGEAYLTMQPDTQKRRIVEQLARLVRPGGRVGLHEVAFTEDATDTVRAQVIDELTGSIRVNVTPLPASGWEQLLTDAGLTVRWRAGSPLHLLEPRRLVADEGLVGAARFAGNVARDRDARRRVRAMRSAMRGASAHLRAYALVAERTTG